MNQQDHHGTEHGIMVDITNWFHKKPTMSRDEFVEIIAKHFQEAKPIYCHACYWDRHNDCILAIHDKQFCLCNRGKESPEADWDK